MKEKESQSLEKLAISWTKNIGSPLSILIHTILFIGIFGLQIFGINFDKILLILTTIVSLEAIYLAIFIQMSVNLNTARLSEVSEDVGEIQEDIDEIQKDVDEIQEDVGGLEENVKGISEDVEEIGEEIEEDEREADKKRMENRQAIEKMEQVILKLLTDIENLKTKNKKTKAVKNSQI